MVRKIYQVVHINFKKVLLISKVSQEPTATEVVISEETLNREYKKVSSVYGMDIEIWEIK